MATASAGRSALVTAGGKSSSFGQFRVTSFVADNVLKPNDASSIQQTPAPFSSKHPNMEQMAQPRPSSGQPLDRTPSAAPSRSLPQDHNQPNSSPAGGALELVEVTSNPIIEGILGPNKDGRVRNPVPSKLKGKTDQKQGNFGVMHMGMSPGGKKTEAQGRDAAAERDAAARRTSENTASRAKAAQSEKYVPPKKRGLEAALGDPTANRGSPFAVSRDDHRQRARPLAPDETKFEQARLLTLLRSINPLTVVDQICKAVAYFGGIPGAPPPEDGIFPESANTRETGALFIGWLAEIFPDLSAKSPEIPKEVAHGGGKKKGARPSKGKAATLGSEGPSNEPPNSRNGYGFGPAISAPAWGLPPSLALVNSPVPVVPIPLPEARQGGSSSIEQSKPFEPPPPTTPGRQHPDDLANSSASTSKRRRGRPKGSRNKGRSEGPQGSDGGVSNAQYDGNDQVLQPSQSPEIHAAVAKTAQPSQAPSDPAYVPTHDSQPPAASKQPPVNQYPQQPWQTNSHQNHIGQSNHTSSIPPTDELSPEERAVLEAFRNHGSEALNILPSPIVATKTAPEGGQKRKRAPPKPKPNALPAPSFPASNLHSMQNASTLPPSGEAQAAVTKDAMQWPNVDTSTPSAPPAKRPRQRKPKVPSTNEAPPRNHNTAVVSSATPPTAPSTIPDSTASSSQQSLPVSRPPAEGLEAHYERFANLSNQQNGRSHTPTLVQQQQHNNSYKTSSTHTLAQASPQFSQQENTYRTASPHSIAQPSPSFSQPDTNFRTNSTHSLSQPSPSFSQAENAYRAPSTHSMAQPSPAYTSSRAHSQTQPSHQNQYSHFSDSSYIDLPTLESLGHSGSSGTTNVSLSGGAYGQSIGVGLGASRSSAGTNSLYGTSSSLTNAYDSGTSDLYRGVSRAASNNTAYGTASSGLSNAFDEHLLRGMGRR
ncbi:hypothetical protein L207DRAFT_413619 [Hyaloscypha variabilis F]|uniref:Uncharacterized protein n=1 Tax=Hyaloscypha variabilis (strain UAMH 11265 / GT02V1 / F) TaxID=1149755 RepID=A0A2J6SD40_HYAVF|nr:hypothetical protein L207DRAFT_413619 [Hyaloscypha variabilis F]